MLKLYKKEIEAAEQEEREIAGNLRKHFSTQEIELNKTEINKMRKRHTQLQNISDIAYELSSALRSISYSKGRITRINKEIKDILALGKQEDRMEQAKAVVFNQKVKVLNFNLDIEEDEERIKKEEKNLLAALKKAGFEIKK